MSNYSEFVSPYSGGSLELLGGALTDDDGEKYLIEGDIVDLLDSRLRDEALMNEVDVFENLHIQNVCYFSSEVTKKAIDAVFSRIDEAPVNFAEIGGGEGYLASAFKKRCPQGTSYVCDVSKAALNNAASDLVKVRCDVRYPYLAENSLDIAAFWVSFHHFQEADLKKVMDNIKKILKPDGLLLIFEPNNEFMPRQIILNSFISRLVYFDEEEKALTCNHLSILFDDYGFERLYTIDHNPSYNYKFLKLLKFGYLFYPITEFFYRIEKYFGDKVLRNWDKGAGSNGALKRGSYIFGIYRKRG